jgi:molybdenum cofactor biosynthesis enzyme MoaA
MNGWGHRRFKTYMFEPTNHCNLACPLCPTGNHSNSRNKGFLDPVIFEKVLDVEPIRDCQIWLWGWGEPLLHPHLSMLVAASKRRNNSVEVQSNGTAPYEFYRRLVEAGLDVLTISLDGMSDATVHPLRGPKASSSSVRERILQLTSLCRSNGSGTKIHVQCLATRFNEQEIKAIRDWSLQVAKADAFGLKTLCLGELTEEKAEHFLPKDPSLIRYAVDRRGAISMPPRALEKCFFLQNVRVVFWDFTVVPCCYDYGGEYGLGSMLSGLTEEAFPEKLTKMEASMCAICPELRGKDTFVGEEDPSHC